MATNPSQVSAGGSPAKAGEAGGARQAASQAVETVQERTEGMRVQARERARSELDGRSTKLGEQVGSFAQALRESGRRLENEGNPGAKAAHTAADQVERLGGYLRESDADRFLGDVESFARQRPWLAAGIGAAVGFAASRFLKASAETRYQAGRRNRLDSDWPVSRGLGDEAPVGGAARRETRDEPQTVVAPRAVEEPPLHRGGPPPAPDPFVEPAVPPLGPRAGDDWERP